MAIAARCLPWPSPPVRRSRSPVLSLNGPTTVSGQTFPRKNEGHSGWGISEVTPYSGGNAGIATVIPTPAFSSNSGGTPEIVLLHIGTNDSGSFSASQMVTDLNGLLDKIISNAPNALVVVAQIILLGYGTNDVIKTYNQAIPGLVQQRVAAGKHVVLVDMYTGFTASSMLGSATAFIPTPPVTSSWLITGTPSSDRCYRNSASWV